MVDRIHITQGKIEDSTYIFLSNEKPPIVRSLRYGLSDKEINKIIRKRRTCKVDPSSFVPSPWTFWLKEKKKNS